MHIDWGFFWAIAMRIGSRYYIIAGFVFIAFYVLLKKKWHYKKLQPKDAKNTDYLREII